MAEMGKTEEDLIKSRKDKRAKLEEFGIDCYPAKSDRNYTVEKVLASKEEFIAGAEELKLAGRITALRGHGAIMFGDLVDESDKLQLLFKSDNLVEDFKLLELLDVGDFIQVAGKLFITKAGEYTLEVSSFKLLTKSLRPLPEKWHGLTDLETRYRQRYVDLIVNPKVKDLFYKRSKIIASIRQFLVGNGFIEVDTPTLQPIAGGAVAKPFITHYNAYDRDVFMRIAPELYLKRLIVGGFEKVFEFARCFRNEGVDATHNPEFTNLEFYWAYTDYEKLMEFTEELMRNLVKEVFGKTEIEINGETVDFSKEIPRITFDKFTGGKNDEESFKSAVKKTIQPTFITNHPTDLLPLAKKNEKDPKVVDSFQLIMGGLELVKAFSELNDPIDQDSRFKDQAENKAKGDEEAHDYDADFIKSLEYGMPPTAGWGMGIDRMVMLLTGSKTLREILLFPFMKPEDK
ncbi:MAG: lysine--tRNA ligase [Candidatus Berkelbacteria bacterium]|nr:lysine--tRNA ligase [Candidatus Berkelbacteria bacterium]